jgi:hypothetical protein
MLPAASSVVIRIGLVACALAMGAPAACRSNSADDLVEPPPRTIPYLGVRLPSSVRQYYAYEEGMQHSLLQLRFSLATRDLPVLASRLPCRLGPVTAGPPEYGNVGPNTRPWYRPEAVERHSGCDYHQGLRTASFLVDLGRPERVVVYAVIASE